MVSRPSPVLDLAGVPRLVSPGPLGWELQFTRFRDCGKAGAAENLCMIASAHFGETSAATNSAYVDESNEHKNGANVAVSIWV